MKTKITIASLLLMASTVILTGCSAPAPSASSVLSDLKPPQGFIEESKKENTITFVALKDGKPSVKEDDFCGPLFDWAYSNQLTRFQLIDNIFELNNYSEDGTEMAKTAAENGPWVAACNSNFVAIDPANEAINKNWDKDIVFFSETEEGIKGSAYVSAGYKGSTKYVKLTVTFDE